MAVDWNTIPKRFLVPVAAFFDLPRAVKAPAPCECGGERSAHAARGCQRCYKRAARAYFVEKWEGRFSDGPTAAEALADFVAPLRNSAGLARAFADALDQDAEPEKFRAALALFGCREFVSARDARKLTFKPFGKQKSDLPPVLKKREIFSATALSEPTIEQIKRMRSEPLYPGGAWWNRGRQWSERDNRELWMLCKGGVPVDLAAARLGRAPAAIAHRAHDAGLVLKPSWQILVRSASLREPRRIPLAYPFISRRRPDHELILTVNAMVPQGLPGREDVCQALMLAILEGRIMPDQLRGKGGTKNKNEFITTMKRENFEANGMATSLFAPIFDRHGDEVGNLMARI